MIKISGYNTLNTLPLFELLCDSIYMRVFIGPHVGALDQWLTEVDYVHMQGDHTWIIQ